MNYSGMWIFTKSNVRDEKLIDEINKLGAEIGFDMTVMVDVEQRGCKYAPKA